MATKPGFDGRRRRRRLSGQNRRLATLSVKTECVHECVKVVNLTIRADTREGNERRLTGSRVNRRRWATRRRTQLLGVWRMTDQAERTLILCRTPMGPSPSTQAPAQ
uniref:Uncharacterized protein n=1 Tax=Plectus sambesii TaxID=2011161 RepID=A0A914VD30_9BILA